MEAGCNKPEEHFIKIKEMKVLTFTVTLLIYFVTNLWSKYKAMLCETIDIDFYRHISSKMADFCSKRISTVTRQVSLMPQAAVWLFELLIWEYYTQWGIFFC